MINNETKIYKNTSRLNNEILKHRLGCIPVHIKPDQPLDELIVEIQKQNNTAEIQYVTSQDFRIKNIKTE